MRATGSSSSISSAPRRAGSSTPPDSVRRPITRLASARRLSRSRSRPTPSFRSAFSSAALSSDTAPASAVSVPLASSMRGPSTSKRSAWLWRSRLTAPATRDSAANCAPTAPSNVSSWPRRRPLMASMRSTVAASAPAARSRAIKPSSSPAPCSSCATVVARSWSLFAVASAGAAADRPAVFADSSRALRIAGTLVSTMRVKVPSTLA